MKKKIAIALIICGVSFCTIAWGQKEIEQSKEVEYLQAMVEKLRDNIMSLRGKVTQQEREIERLRALCEKAGIDPDPDRKIEYAVLGENVYDIPVKTQVELNVLVSKRINGSELRALLNELYTSIKARKGFKHHTSPTNIYIYVFTSEERFNSDPSDWIAMLSKNPFESKEKIYINMRQLTGLSKKSEIKFGLSEQKRIRVYTEYIFAEDKAWKEAEKRHPISVGIFGDTQAQIQIQQKFREQREKRYKRNIARKYRLTKKQLEEIVNEAITNDWPVLPERKNKKSSR